MALQRLELNLGNIIYDIRTGRHQEDHRMLGRTVGGNSVEFFSSSPLADLQAGLRGIYQGDAYHRMCTEIGLIDPGSPLNFDRGFEWNHLLSADLNARVSVRITPPDTKDVFTLLGRNGNVNSKDHYIIQFRVDGKSPPNWRESIAAVLDREPIASRVEIELGFAHLKNMQEFFLDKGLYYQNLVRRQMYLYLATDALYRISGVDNASARFDVEEMIEQAKADRDVPVDIDWLRQVYQKAQMPLPEKFDKRIYCYQALGYDRENEIELSANWMQSVRWNSKDDRMEMVTDAKGAAPKHKLTIVAKPLRLTDDRAYQQLVVDFAKKASALSNEKQRVNYVRQCIKGVMI